MTRISLFGFLGIGFIYYATGAYADDSQNDTLAIDPKIKAAIVQVKIRPASEVVDQLLLFPREESMTSLINGLRSDPEFNDKQVRAVAYNVLMQLHAVNTETGLQQFVTGLTEPGVGGICLAGLLEITKNKRIQVMDPLLRLLDSQDTPGEWKIQIVRSLGKWENDALPAYTHLEILFNNPTAHEHLRWAAIDSMLQVRSLEEVVSQFENLDPVGQKVTFWSLAKLMATENEMAESERSFSPQYVAARDRVRELVLQGMESENLDTRRAALESLSVVYGFDMFVFQPDDKWKWNPKPRTALENMASNDSDPILRERAQKILNTNLDIVANKFYRRQQRKTLRLDNSSE